MSASAQNGTGRNDNEHPAHLDSPDMRELENMPKITVSSVSSVSKGSRILSLKDEFVCQPLTPTEMMPKIIDNPSNLSNSSDIQNDPLELENEIRRSNEVSLAESVDFEQEHDDKNDNDDKMKHDDEEIYYSCQDDGEDENQDFVPLETDDTHHVQEAGKHDYNDETREDDDAYNTNEEQSNVKEKHLQVPDFGKTDIEYSEDEETEGMRLLENMPILMMDTKEEIHAVGATIDTGAKTSVISIETVKYYGLKERPLLKRDIQEFRSIIGSETCTPETFVAVLVKCKKLGIDKFVSAKLRVLYVPGFDIVFGRPFIQRHHILKNLPKFDSSGEPLFILKGSRSNAQKAIDREFNEKRRETFLALEGGEGAAIPSKDPAATGFQESGSKDTGLPFKGAATRSSSGFTSSTSTGSWDVASISWHSKDSSITSRAMTNGSCKSNDSKQSYEGKSLRKF